MDLSIQSKTVQRKFVLDYIKIYIIFTQNGIEAATAPKNACIGDIGYPTLRLNVESSIAEYVQTAFFGFDSW